MKCDFLLIVLLKGGKLIDLILYSNGVQCVNLPEEGQELLKAIAGRCGPSRNNVHVKI